MWRQLKYCSRWYESQFCSDASGRVFLLQNRAIQKSYFEILLRTGWGSCLMEQWIDHWSSRWKLRRIGPVQFDSVVIFVDSFPSWAQEENRMKQPVDIWAYFAMKLKWGNNYRLSAKYIKESILVWFTNPLGVRQNAFIKGDEAIAMRYESSFHDACFLLFSRRMCYLIQWKIMDSSLPESGIDVLLIS